MMIIMVVVTALLKNVVVWCCGRSVGAMVAAVVTGYQVMASCGNDDGSGNNSYGNMKRNS